MYYDKIYYFGYTYIENYFFDAPHNIVAKITEDNITVLPADNPNIFYYLKNKLKYAKICDIEVSSDFLMSCLRIYDMQKEKDILIQNIKCHKIADSDLYYKN